MLLPFLYSLAYVIILGILSHFIGEALPRDRIDPSKFPLKSFNWEQNGNIYEKIGIKKWKNKLPDMSKVIKTMVPKKVGLVSSSSDICRLVKETCVAELIHEGLCLLSPVIFVFWADFSPTAGILLTLLYVFCNIPFIIIQRYNRPHLIRVAERLSIREKKLSHENSDTFL